MIANVHFCVSYIIVDALCLVITVIVAGNLLRDSGSETQVRYFYLLLTANLVFLLSDAVWAFTMFSGVVQASPMVLSVINGMCMTAVAFVGYFWFCFALARFNRPVIHNRVARAAFAIPAVMAPFLHAIGAALGQNVIIGPDGSIVYGTMHTVVACIPVFYLLAATTSSIVEYRRATTAARKRLSLVFISFMIAPAIAGVVDAVMPDVPIAAAGIMVSILFVMMSMQESRISSDALTGLNNRRRAESFLDESLAKTSPEQPLYLFIIDMDDFKDINDTYGHLEGDRALQLMAEALRKTSVALDAFAARWGGDEFVLICTKGVGVDPSHVAKMIEEQLLNAADSADVDYKLACSIGYSVSEAGSETRNQIIFDADQMLYRAK